LKKLKWLSLEDNKIEDIQFIQGLPLERLWLSKNHVFDIGILSQMMNLKWLKLEANYLESINSLKTLTGLALLTLHNNFLNLDKNSETSMIIEELINAGVSIRYEPQNMNSLFQTQIPKN